MDTMWKVLTRKKILDPVSSEQSELGRVLNTLDLTALGVGSTLGVGVYVLAGQVAKDTAGPAVVLSFLIATVASVFAGLCYAEFAARTPRAGSAYIYSYVSVGEFVAFVIGWNLILEYVIGSASVARGLSLYLDTLLNDTLKDTFIDIAPLGDKGGYFSEYFDFFAFGISVILAAALAFGLKESSWANNIFTLVNLIVVVFVVIAGSTKANPDNWKLDVVNVTTNDTDIGDGGFFPFGVEGMIKGAATCFYGFVGFDCIATTGEEVRNPKRAIPIAIIASLFIIFLAYFGTSTVITLMIPYYDQDPNAPLPYAFEYYDMDWAKWIVAIGGIFGLCASLFGAMFPLPRILYAMASDSIIFRFLGQVSSRFKTPVIGTLLAGLLTGLMAALFELKHLIKMMSIGTLLAYTIVAASVLLLRYAVDKDVVFESLLRSVSDSEDSDTYTDNRGLDGGASSEEILDDEIATTSVIKQIFNCGRQNRPSETSENVVKVEVCLYCIFCVCIGLCVMYMGDAIGRAEIWAIVITAVFVALAVSVIMSIAVQPKSRKELSFKVPLVPLIPALSILINVYLMLMLDSTTWIRFGVWMVVGLPIYYFSVKSHSDARNESLCSRDVSITANGKLNGFSNHGFVEDEATATIKKKRLAPLPPTVAATIADLDEMLENEEANINDRKYSADSLSTDFSVLREENVQADVHCSDIPIASAPPLLQSSDVPSIVPNQYSDVDPVDIVIIQAEIPITSEEKTSSTLKEKDDPKTVNENEEIVDDNPIIDVEEKKEITEDNPTNEKEMVEETEIDGENEIEKDTVSTNSEPLVPPPPPPPPPESVKTINDIEVEIPRPHFELGAFTSVKLKSVQDRKPETPPIDYSRQNSTLTPVEGNLKFGSQEYKEFIEQLDQKLQVGYVPTEVKIELMKSTPTSSNRSSQMKSKNVVDDHINRNDAKEKLAQLLERTNSLPNFKPGGMSNRQFNIQNNAVEDLTGFREQHTKNMDSIFRSIKLRKTDSFKNDEESQELNNPEEKISQNEEIPQKENEDKTKNNTPKNDDRQQHQQNMNNILKSIRLRKIDSFKEAESQ